jgi:hypothetical protein
MTTKYAPAGNLVKARGRGILLSTLGKDVIVTRIKLLDNGSFVVETKDWDS